MKLDLNRELQITLDGLYTEGELEDLIILIQWIMEGRTLQHFTLKRENLTETLKTLEKEIRMKKEYIGELRKLEELHELLFTMKIRKR